MAQRNVTAGRAAATDATERAPDQPQAATDKDEAKGKRQLDKELDKALEDSFPASDPPTPSQPTGTEPAGDPKTKP